MSNDNVILEVKSGWKIFQLGTSILALSGFAFLLKQLIGISGYIGAGGVFLVGFFALGIIGMLYIVIYCFRHSIVFDDSGMKRVGILNKKVISYSDIDELHFNDKMWRAGNLNDLVGNSRKIMIDYKYTNYDEALAYLREALRSKETQLIEA